MYNIKSNLIDLDLININIKTLSYTNLNSKVIIIYLSLIVEINDINFNYIISNINNLIE